MRELATEDGGFASALDADSEGEEGRFYVVGASIPSSTPWLEAGPRRDRKRRRWPPTGVSCRSGNWEGRYDPARRRTCARCRARRARPRLAPRRACATRCARAATTSSWRPGTGWRCAPWPTAALVLGGERYVEATRSACARFMRGHLLRDGGRPLAHGPLAVVRTRRPSPRTTRTSPMGCWPPTRRSARWRTCSWPSRSSIVLIADFWDEASGTFFDTSAEHERAVARPRSLLDDATPARANAVAADVLLRLALLTGEPDLRPPCARSILRAVELAPWIGSRAQFGRMLSAADRALVEPIDAVIAGDPDATRCSRAAPRGGAAVRPGPGHRATGARILAGRLAALPGQGRARGGGHRLRLSWLRLRRADQRPGSGRRPGGQAWRQPGRKLSLTVRAMLSRFGSSRAIDCHVPRPSRPPTTGTVTLDETSSGST